ncbi:MAG: low-specificity L-threonine aldolase [Pseudomonadales bacterium]
MTSSAYPSPSSTTQQCEIDFRSDTFTAPTQGMRRAMAEAAVGDDVYGEDPTVNALEDYASALLNKEAALFVPSGTMSNLIALLTHCQRGDEVIIGDQYHVYCHEAGGASTLGGIVMQPLPTTPTGGLSAQQVMAAIRPADFHFARSRLVSLENTVNGVIQPQAVIDDICQRAKAQQLNTHLDGARLMHAAVASQVPVASLVQHVDSVSLCLSKGLGAPVGSVLAGSADFIARARSYRKMLGGGMRQAGIIAAAGLYALEHQVTRLDEDHTLARYLSEQLSAIESLPFDSSRVSTNMLFIDFPKHGDQHLSEYLLAQGINIGDSAAQCRLVVHLNINREIIDRTVALIKKYYA